VTLQWFFLVVGSRIVYVTSFCFTFYAAHIYLVLKVKLYQWYAFPENLKILSKLLEKLLCDNLLENNYLVMTAKAKQLAIINKTHPVYNYRLYELLVIFLALLY